MNINEHNMPCKARREGDKAARRRTVEVNLAKPKTTSTHQLVTLTPRPALYWCPTPAPLLTTWRKSVLLSNVSKRRPNTIGTQFQIWNLLYVRLIMCFETPLYSVLLTTVNNNTLNKTISLPSLLSPHFKLNSYNCHNSLK